MMFDEMADQDQPPQNAAPPQTLPGDFFDKLDQQQPQQQQGAPPATLPGDFFDKLDQQQQQQQTQTQTKEPPPRDDGMGAFRKEHPYLSIAPDFVGGIGAGAFSTARGLNQIASKGASYLPGSPQLPVVIPKEWAEPPPSTAGKLGFGTEQLGEFFIPATKAAQATKAVEATKLPWLTNKLATGAVKLGGKAAIEAIPAYGITYAQTGGDADAARNAAILAGGTTAALPLVGKVLKSAYGKMTGVGAESVERAATQPTPELMAAMRGDISEKEILEATRQVVENVAQKRSVDYVTRLGKLDPRIQVPLRTAHTAASQMLADLGVTGAINPQTGKLVLNFDQSVITNGSAQQHIIDTIKDLDNWNRFDPRSVDVLKRRVDSRYREVVGGLTNKGGADQARAFVARVRGELADSLNKYVPGYQAMTKEYAEASNFLDDLTDLSTHSKNDGVGIRKLAGSLNQNNGYRSALLDELSAYTPRDIKGMIAGSRLNAWEPRGIVGAMHAATGMGAGYYLHQVAHDPAALAISLAGLFGMSPRVVGEAAAKARLAARFGKTAAAATPRMIQVTGQQPNYDNPQFAEGGQVDEDEPVLRDLKRRLITINPEQSKQRLFGDYQAPPKAAPAPAQDSIPSDTSFSDAMSKVNPMPEWYQQASQPFLSSPVTGGAPVDPADIVRLPQSKGEAAILAAGALIPGSKLLKGAKGAIAAGTGMLEGAAPETGQLSRALSAAEEIPPASQRADVPVSNFTTSQGSTYVVNGQSTTRTKTPHIGHDPSDVGVKQPSHRTVYVDPQFATEVGMWNTSSSTGKRIMLGEDGKVTLVSTAPGSNRPGRDPLVYDSRFSTEPKTGLAPLELFNPSDISGRELYSGNHPGNAITSIAQQQLPTSQQLATGKEQPVLLQNFVASRGMFASPARMVIRSPRRVEAEEIRQHFFPDYGPDRLQIQKLRADDFMDAVQPGRQPFRLQFADEHGRHIETPEGIEERFGLQPGENYHGKAKGGPVRYDEGGDVEQDDDPDGVLRDLKRRTIQLGPHPGQFWQQPITIHPEQSKQRVFGDYQAPQQQPVPPPPVQDYTPPSDTSFSDAMSKVNPMPEWYQQADASINQPFVSTPIAGSAPMNIADLVQLPQSKTEAGLLMAGALIPGAKVVKGAKGALKAGTAALEGAAPEAGVLSKALANVPRSDITAEEVLRAAAEGPGKFGGFAKYMERNPTAGEGLFDTSNAQPSLPGRPPIERYDPSLGRGRGPSARVVDAFNNPKVINGLKQYIRAGAKELPPDWYANDPLFKKYQQEWGPLAEEKFFNHMGYQSATSSGSAVPDNIRTGTLYNYLSEQGLPFPEMVEPAPGEKPKLSVPKGYGHEMQIGHWNTAKNFRDTGGIDALANPKRASFTENLMGNEDWLTADRHFMRLVGILSEDPRFLKTTAQVSREGKIIKIKPQEMFNRGELTMEQAKADPNLWVEAPNDNEYLYLENQFRNKVAKPMKYTVADAQGKAWIGGKDVTGMASPGRSWIDIFRQRVQYTADRLNVDPQVILRKVVRGEIPLLELGVGAAGLGALGWGQGQASDTDRTHTDGRPPGPQPLF
jgi:hypothetical protein